MTRRIVVIVGSAALGAVLLGTATWLYIGRSGSSELENWIGRQVIGVLQAHLTPAVSFEDLDYQAPRTVIVRGLRFVADNRPILSIERARLELAEIPRRDRPIQIQEIRLDAPRFEFLADRDGTLVGWSRFVRPRTVKDPGSVPPGLRLSDVLVLRHLAIKDGELVYADIASPGADRMTLPGVNLELRTPPEANEAGWYRLSGKLSRDPVFDAGLEGRINLDTGLLELARFELAASLGEQQYATLPPALQGFLRAHEVHGAFTASARGKLPLSDPAGFAGALHAELKDGRFRQGGTAMPVRQVRLDADVPAGKINLTVAGLGLMGEHHPLLQIEALRVRLPGMPRPGERLRVELAEIFRPHVTFAWEPDNGMSGWSKLAESVSNPDQPPTDAGPLLRSVQLDEFRITDGAVSYRPAAGGEPLTLAGIQVRLALDPSPPGSPQAVPLTGSIDVGPLLTAQLRGRLDSRTSAIEIDRFDAAGQITPESRDQLPPEARNWLGGHDVRGRIGIKGEGRVDLADPSKSTFRMSAELAEATMRYHGITIPVGAASAAFTLPERSIRTSVSDLSMLAGDQAFFRLKRLDAGFTVPAGGPVIVEDVQLDRPEIALLPGRGSSMVGWEDLPASPGTTTPRGRGSSLPAFRRARITNARVSYLPAAGREPLVVEGIHLEARPAGTGTGQVELAGTIDNSWLKMESAATLDLPARLLEVTRCTVSSTFSPDTYGSLPEGLSRLLAPYQVQGAFRASLTGRIPLDDLKQSAGNLEVDGQRLALRWGNGRIPADRVVVKAAWPDGPCSVTAERVTLSVEDKPLAGAGSLRVETASAPWKAGPPVITRMHVEEPFIDLAHQKDGGFGGWSRLAGDTRHEPASSGPADDAGLLSRVRIEHAEITRARVSYEGPLTSGPIVLQNLNATARSAPDGRGPVLKFSGDLACPEVLTIKFDGQYDPAHAILGFADLSLKLRLDGMTMPKLSPRMRESLVRHLARGNVTASWKGSIPLRHPRGAQGHLEISGADTDILLAGLQWPAGQLEIKADLPNGPVTAAAQKLRILRGDLDLLSVPGAELQIAQLPNGRNPLVVQRLSVEQPRLRLVSSGSGYLGWSDLKAERPNATRGTAVPAITIVVRRAQVRGGEVIYDAAGDSPPLVLPAIDANLSMEPAEASWYRIDGRIQQRQLLEVMVNGRCRPEDMLLDIATLRLRASLNETLYASLPPSLRAFAEAHRLAGSVALDGRARVPVRNLEQVQGEFSATLQSGRLMIGQTVWPVDRLELAASADHGTMKARYDAALLGGNARGNIAATLTRDQPFSFDWQVSGARLERLLQAVQQQEPEYSGALASQGRLEGRLANFPASVAGSGQITVDKGKLIQLPVIRDIVALLSMPLGLHRPGSDRGQMAWEFRPDHVQIGNLEVDSSLASFRGKGRVYYDGRLDLGVTTQLAQLPEKGPRLPAALGRVGNLVEDIGNLGTRLIGYEVRGTIESPRVIPVPLGVTGK